MNGSRQMPSTLVVRIVLNSFLYTMLVKNSLSSVSFLKMRDIVVCMNYYC